MEISQENQGKKWLIIFLIYADFTAKKKPEEIENLKVTINNMLGDIITTPIVPEQSRMFVVMNTIKFVFNDPQNGIDDKCVFYTMERTPDLKQNYISKCEIFDNSEYYKADPQGGMLLQRAPQLEHILQKTCLTEDEEVFLIAWDHGSSFGVFRAEPPVFDANAVKNEVEKNLSQYAYLKIFWDRAKEEQAKKRDAKSAAAAMSAQLPGESEPVAGTDTGKDEGSYIEQGEAAGTAESLNKAILPDAAPPANQQVSAFPQQPKAPEILKNGELNEALAGWLGTNRKIGVLLMVNCWMMNMHTMYALRDTVRCLVAPQGSIDCPGYNIRDILLHINNPVEITTVEPTELAEVCVSTIDNDYSNAKATILNSIEPDVIERFKIFAVDLSLQNDGKSCLENQVEALDALGAQLAAEISGPTAREDLKYFCKYIRSVCFDFSGNKTKTIDIINWVKSLKQAHFTLRMTMLSPSTKKRIDAFFDSISALSDNSIILNESSGKKIYIIEKSEDHWAAIGLAPTGYSLFFPIIYPAINPDLVNLKDNVYDDALLIRLKGWRDFLVAIDHELLNFFPDLP